MKVTEHGSTVMRHQNSAISCGAFQNFRIVDSV